MFKNSILLSIIIVALEYTSQAQSINLKELAQKRVNTLLLETDTQASFSKLKIDLNVNNNILKIPFVHLMTFYRNTLSEQFAANCPYSPSCSRFAVGIIKNKGLIKGIFYSIDRIHRCNKNAYDFISPIYLDNSTGNILDDPSHY